MARKEGGLGMDEQWELTLDTWIDILHERKNQNEKWGIRRHTMGDWLKILVEELGEVAQAMQIGDLCHKESDANDLYKELIQVAAVACAIAEQVREETNNGRQA